MRDFIQRKARWFGPLAGMLALLAVLWSIRAGLGWVDEKSERDRLRAELDQAGDLLAALEACILAGPKPPATWLPHAIARQYAPDNPTTHLRRCQEQSATARPGEIRPWTAAWVVTAAGEPDTACTYLSRVEQRLAALGRRAELSPSLPERGSCKADDWPLVPELFEPELPDQPPERVRLAGYGADEHGQPTARLAYPSTAYGAPVREQVRARYQDGAWHLLHEPLDALDTHWSGEHAVSITRGSPQTLWLPEHALAPAGSGELAVAADAPGGLSTTWRRAADLPERLLVQDVRVTGPESARALTLAAVHAETRQWFALSGEPATGALGEPVPLTPPLVDSRPRATGATRTSPAQRVGHGQYCRPRITPAGHVVLACLAHPSDTASAMHIHHAPPGGSTAEVGMHAFDLPTAMDAEVIDVCGAGETIWLATRVSSLFASRDSGRTFARHALPALGSGSIHCSTDTWTWVGELVDPAPGTPAGDGAVHQLVSCTADTGCAAPVPLAGRAVERVLVSTDGAALLLLSFAQNGSSGALQLERAAPDRPFVPTRVGRVDTRASQRQRLGWHMGERLFIDSPTGAY